MPILLSPRSKFPVVLDSDDDTEPKPTFVFRAVSCHERMQLAEEAEAMVGIKSVLHILEAVIVDWKGMVGPEGKEIPFSAAELGGFIVPEEANELLDKFVAGNRPSADDKKKFGSPL